MPIRKRGTALEKWEIALIKSMLVRGGYNDQDILAYFTRPTRSVNHRVIGEIRLEAKHKATLPASPDALDEFLSTWPDIDPLTGLSLRGDELLVKAREAMIAAVHTFNGAGLSFRAELFIVTSIIAWTYLMHAYYWREGIDYRYRNAAGTIEHTANGAEKYWELGKCIRHARCPLTRGTVLNIEFILELRHEIEHRSTSRIDDSVSAKLQACCINFNETIKILFGQQYGLERRLPIALQFVTFGSDQRAVLKRASSLPPNIEAMMDAFHGRLTEKEQGDPQFAYRVAFVPKLVSRASRADLAVEFVKADSEEAQAINRVLLKEVERPKYGAKQIVAKMREEGFRKFNLANHKDLWKANDAKNPGKGYGVEILGSQWCWYDSWLERVRVHCQEHAHQYE
jgi:Protein of unknown function (DUF3644)